MSHCAKKFRCYNCQTKDYHLWENLEGRSRLWQLVLTCTNCNEPVTKGYSSLLIVTNFGGTLWDFVRYETLMKEGLVPKAWRKETAE